MAGEIRTTAPGLAAADQLRRVLDRHGRRLLALAASSIRHRLERGSAAEIDVSALPEELGQPGASFVTLTRHGELRGCIGSIRAWRPLAFDVAANAEAAAFEEPRFPPLAATELEGLAISASVLTPPEPVEAASEVELLDRLRPGIDGLILREGQRQGVFLPQVWAHAASGTEFLALLREKAGLPPGYWSAALRIQRFETVSVKGDDLFA